MRTNAFLLSLLASMLLAAPALAQDPSFKFGDKTEVKDVTGVEWTASAQAGLILTTGNSQTRTTSAGAKASRKEGNNKFSAEAGGAYARSTILVGVDSDMSGAIDANELLESSATTAKGWLAKLRYDRFLSDRDSLFLTAIVSSDEPAGKEFVGGGQLGYARILVKSDVHTVSTEIGYDFSYEAPTTGDAVSIHSLRGFAGYEGKLTADTGLGASVEALFNVNELDTGTREIAAFEDARVNSNLSLTTKVFKNVSFRFAFGARFDNAPSLRAPGDIPFAADFQPVSDELDTKTEATLIVNFL